MSGVRDRSPESHVPESDVRSQVSDGRAGCPLRFNVRLAVDDL